jgi:replicative DNA helicase
MLAGWSDPTAFQPADFSSPAHRMIHGAILSLHQAGTTPDMVLVSRELASQPTHLWQTELASLPDHAIARENAHLYAAALRREVQHRELRQMTRVLMGDLDSGSLPEDLQSRLRAMAELSELRADRGPRHIGDALSELFLTGSPRPVPLPLDGLSRLRVLPGDLCVLGARPACGKTAMLGTVALHAANAGWQVLFLSLEMPEIQIRQRILSADSGIPLTTVMLAEDPALISHAQNMLRLPIWIEDRVTEMTLERLFAFVQSFAHTRADRPSVVLLDYLQLVRTSARYDRRYEAIGHVCRELKRLSLSAHVPIIVAAQLSRAAEQRGKDSKPQLSDLRESGEIEQVADQVVLMHREPGKTLLRVAKYRMGPTFTTDCWFAEERCVFEDFGYH